MQKTKLYILLSVFALLSILYWNRGAIMQIFQPKTAQPFAQLKKENVTEIEIKNEAQTSRIFKKDKTWKVQMKDKEFNASPNIVDDIITTLSPITKDELISQNKDKHPSFGIGPKKITVKTASVWYTVYVGNIMSTDKNYIRIGEENNIYTAENVDSIFTSNDYRDLYVHFVNKEDAVQTANITYDTTNLLFEKKGNDWLMNSKKAKHEPVDFYINAIKTLKATDMLQPAEIKEKLTKPVMTIKVKENNEDKTAEFFAQPIKQASQENTYYLKVSNSSDIYIINQETLTDLKKIEKNFVE